MDQYTIYIVVSFICIALACCFCRDDDDDGIDIRFRDDAIIIDEESRENASDIMIEIVNVGDDRFKDGDDRFKDGDDRFSEFYGDHNNVREYGEI
jgi:hypothetical protein